jgi:hypothetical protein
MSSEFSPKPNYDGIYGYPNPFRTQINVEFAVNETTPVNIAIYDIGGKKVADLITSNIYAQGNYATIFNGSYLAAGTYNCVMTTRDDRETISIIKN